MALNKKKKFDPHAIPEDFEVRGVEDVLVEDEFPLINEPKILTSKEILVAEEIEELAKVHDPEFTSVPTEFEERNEEEEQKTLHQTVERICMLIKAKELPMPLIDRLVYVTSPYQVVEFDEDFNIRDELLVQMRLVKAVRSDILSEDGSMKSNTTVGEVKSVLDASMRLATQLNAVNKDLINQERMQAVEASFMEVIGTMSQEQQLIYVRELERRMKIKRELAKK